MWYVHQRRVHRICTPNLQVRQYWNAVFLPIMRVHQMHGTPRFPYLWGGADAQVGASTKRLVLLSPSLTPQLFRPIAQAGFRAALNMRYAFLPHIYSLAHLTRDASIPMALPASYVFPNDPTFPTSVGDTVLMFRCVPSFAVCGLSFCCC
jgi:alpha-glucosidase (family GH31 glycosyl hydrolase)